MNWLIAAILSALFAGLTSILAKVGVSGVESNLGTAIRTGVVVSIDKPNSLQRLRSRKRFIWLREGERLYS